MREIRGEEDDADEDGRGHPERETRTRPPGTERSCRTCRSLTPPPPPPCRQSDRRGRRRRRRFLARKVRHRVAGPAAAVKSQLRRPQWRPRKKRTPLVTSRPLPHYPSAPAVTAPAAAGSAWLHGRQLEPLPASCTTPTDINRLSSSPSLALVFHWGRCS